MAEQRTEVMAPGDLVGIAMGQQAAKSVYVVGELQAVDDWAVRVTTFDYLIGMFCGYDMVIPRSQILAVDLAVPGEHDTAGFPRHAGHRQRWHKEQFPEFDSESSS